jgi:hypothetical protein
MKEENYHRPIIQFYARMGAPETIFFISLVSLFFIPFITDIQGRLLNSFLFTFFILSLYYLIHSLNPKRKFLFIIPLFIALVASWLKHFGLSIPMVVDSFFEVVIMMISFYFIFKSIFNTKSININTLMAAISGYLLIGIGFGQIVHVFESFNATSFSFKEAASMHESYYYSFVTMSTLGYGDVVPLTVRAKGLAILITLTGQFYMAVVIGIIIGKFIAGPKETKQ